MSLLSKTLLAVAITAGTAVAAAVTYGHIQLPPVRFGANSGRGTRSYHQGHAAAQA